MIIEEIRVAVKPPDHVAGIPGPIAYLAALYHEPGPAPRRCRPLAAPPRAPSLAAAERRAALALQWEYVAWRRRTGLEPDPDKVRAVDRVIGDRYEAGNYAFPGLHQDPNR